MKKITTFLKAVFFLSFLILQIAAYAQPVNDSICNATPISISLGCTEGTNVGATISDSVFSPSCWGGSPISNDVWYKFVATVPGITVSTDVQGLTLNNTQIAIYKTSDNSCTGTLTQVGCDDNSGTNVANNSIANMASLVPGNVYFIRVDGSGTATGTFCIGVTDTYVPGSNPCEAQVVHPNNLSCQVSSAFNRHDNGNRVNNAISPSGYYPPLGVDYPCSINNDETNQYGTWTTFIANSASITITNEVTGAGGNRNYVLFSVPTINDCSNLTCVSADTAAAAGNASFSGLTIGTQYFILTTLTGSSTATGFRTDMCVKSSAGCTPPPNDNCANAQPIVIDSLYLVTTYCATADTPPDLCAGQSDNTIWFTWTVPSTWTGSAFFQLYHQNCTGGDGASGSQVSVYDPGVHCGSPTSTANCAQGATSNTQTDNNITIVWTPTPGATYLIAFDGYAHEVCDMRFEITNTASTSDITVNSTEICPGGSAVLTASGANTYVWSAPGDPADGATTASITVSPSVTTSYVVSSTTGKIGSATGFVIVKPLPILNSSLSPVACSGKLFSYTPTSKTSGTSFTWKRAAVAGISNDSAFGTGNPNEILIDTTLLPVYIKYVYISTANGCNDAPKGDTVIVKVNPAAIIQNYTDTICSKKTFTIIPTNGFPTAATKIPVGTTYTWSAPTISPAGIITGDSAVTIGKDSISQTLTNLTHSKIATVTYTVTPTLNSCSGNTFTVTVTVNPSDSSLFYYPLSTYCRNDTTHDTIAIVTGLHGGTFKSVPPNLNGFNDSTGKFNLRISPVGTYTVTYVTNGICIDSSTFNITITEDPHTQFSYNNLAYCQYTANPSPIFILITTPDTSTSSAGIFTVNPVGLQFAPGAFTHAGITDSSQTGEIDLTTSSPGTYTVTNSIAAVGICLPSVYSVPVTINPAPVMTNTVTATTICSGNTLSISLSPSVPSSLTWIAADNDSTTGESITKKTTSTINDIITNHSLIQETVIYTVTPTSNPQGCLGALQTINVAVNPKPNMTSSSNTISICSGATISRALKTDLDSTTTTFQWFATPIASITGASTTIETTDTLRNTLINTSASVMQIVTYTITPTSNPEGCVGNSQTIKVRVNPQPVLTNSAVLSICSGNSAPITLNTASMPTYSLTYTWIATDNPHTTGESTSLQTTKTISDIRTNDTTTVQIITYTAIATSTGGGKACHSTPQIIHVTVNPIPAMTNAGLDTICSGVPLNIPLISDVVSTYTWKAANNPNTTGASTTAQTTDTITNTIIDHTSSVQTVVYTVTPKSTATPSCPGAAKTVSVTVNPSPKMTSDSTSMICGDGNPISDTLASDIASTYTWQTTDNPNTTGESTTTQTTNIINDSIRFYATTHTQTLNYTVTPTSIAGHCLGTAQTVVVTVAQPIAAFTKSPENGTPPLLVNFTNNSQNANTYNWLFGDGARDTAFNTQHTYITPPTLPNTVYTITLIASNKNLCPDTATSTVIVYKLVIANVFTPNGDGINDEFKINPTGISSLSMEIFNRWGIKVFEFNTPENKWNGYYSNGKLADDGTYYYIAKATGIDGQQYTEKGYITLLKEKN